MNVTPPYVYVTSIVYTPLLGAVQDPDHVLPDWVKVTVAIGELVPEYTYAFTALMPLPDAVPTKDRVSVEKLYGPAAETGCPLTVHDMVGAEDPDDEELVELVELNEIIVWPFPLMVTVPEDGDAE
jgi:hypothetical protein